MSNSPSDSLDLLDSQPSQLSRSSALIGLCSYLVLAIAVYDILPSPVHKPAAIPLTVALGGDTTGYQRAEAPQPFHFPADHGPHPNFRTEWWYATGNLADPAGRHFGYQLTLFRIALAPPDRDSDISSSSLSSSAPSSSAPSSAWRTRQLYMGHFALTDVAGGRHHAFERFSRAAVGLAGAQAEPFRVWLEDWAFESVLPDDADEKDQPSDREGPNDTDQAIFPLRLRARDDGVTLNLTLQPLKPLVLQGDHGLSQKSHEPGNASYYYSYTRLASHGTITIQDQTFTVSGHSWLDREWSTSALGAEQSGWDWFALQLDDGHDLMFYRLRRHDGTTDVHSRGVWVNPKGDVRPLMADEVTLEVRDTWISPHTGDRYPSHWFIKIPTLKAELHVTPLLPDQEMRLSVRYWEGAVAVTGQRVGQAIQGRGYLEMTQPSRRH